MRRIAVVLAILALAACAGIPQPPAPTPTPVVTPSPVCASGQTHSCYAQPPGKGWVYVCPVYNIFTGAIEGTTEVANAAACVKPVIVGGLLPVPPYLDDAALHAKAGDMSARMWAQVAAAIDAYRAALPGDWRGDGACLTDASGIDRAFGQIAAQLVKAGVEAGQSRSRGGQLSDAVFVFRPGTQDAEEWHLFDYQRGCVVTGPNGMKGVWTRGAASGQAPTPSPVVGKCPEPRPPRLNADGVLAWKLSCHPHVPSWLIDCTPVTVQQLAYCEAIGMSPMADGTPRAGCPMRPDSHPERPSCEAYVAGGGYVLESRFGGTCAFADNGNPLQFIADGGRCRLCSKGEPKVCGEWF